MSLLLHLKTLSFVRLGDVLMILHLNHKTSGDLINSGGTISGLLHSGLSILGSINQRINDVVAYLSHNPPQKTGYCL